MSRIGKKPITIPSGVTVAVEDGMVRVKGPKGNLSRQFKDDINIAVADKEVVCSVRKDSKLSFILWGTYASHIKNMIEGVANGFEKKLEIEGIGYKAKEENGKLILNLGFSHPVEVAAPAGIKFTVVKNLITVSGIDKELVGEMAAKIRAHKKPDPYKGKGIHYLGEVIRRKAGKKAAASA
ncbi:MAG: 50S ribosomal protein L6 [Candidatus Niyogibacteria bacterium]|nr:50S ribosomal protein L6 [Candidatus Niyogibacteria bacterium]